MSSLNSHNFILFVPNMHTKHFDFSLIRTNIFNVTINIAAFNMMGLKMANKKLKMFEKQSLFPSLLHRESNDLHRPVWVCGRHGHQPQLRVYIYVYCSDCLGLLVMVTRFKYGEMIKKRWGILC